MIEILEEAIVYEDKNYYPAFPSIIKLENDHYLVSFRLAPKESKKNSHLNSLSKIMIVSIYKNKIKYIQEIAEDDDAAKQDVNFFRIDEKTIMLYYFRYTFHPQSAKKHLKEYTYLEYDSNLIALLSGVGICMSYNNGETFESPYFVRIDNDIKHFAVRGNMCKIENEILMPIYALKEKNKYQSYIISSKNYKKWKIKSFLAETENIKKDKFEFVEPSLISYNNNIASFIRTHKNNEEAYTSVAYSTNKGRTFSNPIRTNILGYPINTLILESEKVLITYGYRKKPYGVRGIILNSIEEVFDIEKINNSKEIIIENKMKSPDCGYPWCIEDNGKIICLYYGHLDSTRAIYMKKFRI